MLFTYFHTTLVILSKVEEVRNLGLMIWNRVKRESSGYLVELMEKGILAMPAGKTIGEEEITILLNESTYRIEKLLNELSEYMPERFITIHRELTKKFEESWRGYPSELLPLNVIKGEFVVIFAPISWK